MRYVPLGLFLVCSATFFSATVFLNSKLSAEEPKQPPRLEFTRMVGHLSDWKDDSYPDFVSEAQVEIAQHGFYGAHFWSLVHTPAFGGYPAHLPVQGIPECRVWHEQRNADLHKRNIKVVGHFNVEFLVGDPDSPEGPRGFFKFYRDLWDESILGPKPVEDPLTMMEQNPPGKPITQDGYGIGGMKEYWACLRNPNWQKVLKAWMADGIRRGADGFVANYFYRHDCLCEHCQRGFRDYMKHRFTAEELKAQFQIADIDNHLFPEIVAWHNPAESTPLRREMLRFSQISNKQVFDEVFIKFGRSLKPDLIVGQWNHLGNFSQIAGDERCMLPADLWGKDESYLWYSMGSSGHYTDLDNRYLGEGTLQSRYIRGAFDDNPFPPGKYENTRTRVAISELAANGGAPMGLYCRYTNPEARAVFVQYYGFMKRHDELFHANRSYAEAVLLFPRKRIHAGQVEAVQAFRDLGTKLLDAHVLFDILPDDAATAEQLARYRHVFTIDKPGEADRDLPAQRSRFEAPYTVRVSANRPAQGEGEIDLHFVNYNREEPPKNKQGQPSAGGGIQDEKPIAAENMRVDFVLPTGYRARSVVAISPESPDPAPLEFVAEAGRVKFTMPEIFVYGIARITLEQE